MKRIALAAAALAVLTSMPASGGEVGIGVGPVGVTVGSSPGPRYRETERTYIREREPRDREVTIIKRDRERPARRTTVIEHDD